jgi:radical SAM superfamily enzyme YgiQ (UPF0313 family)
VSSKKIIYLADLTHTGPVISAGVVPLGLGFIASYLLEKFPDSIEVKLFKYPKKLNAALKEHKPDIIAFSNFSWNCNIAHEYARRIKEVSPETVIVFGGPNYDLAEKEIEAFWQKYPVCDFYIVREVEQAFLELFNKLVLFDFNPDNLKKTGMPVPNCHYQLGNKIIKGNILPRVDINNIPSPYLAGIMDDFFDEYLIPLVCTTRGCPFNCTYCGEGDPYLNTVFHRSDIKAEFEYIAQHVHKNQNSCIITDSNFGMFKEDIKKAEIIAETRKQYGWPGFLFVNNGKNAPKRIIEISSILEGAMTTSASLQTTDPLILKNISRDNISQDDLRSVAQLNRLKDGDVRTEIILGLPGDTILRHEKSLRDAIEIGFTIIRVPQLILIPQTAMNSPESLEKFEMISKYRIAPRSFGRYDILGEFVDIVEYEKICVANNTMSYEDYLSCRELDLSIEILHNSSLFVELAGLCQFLGLSWFELLKSFHENRYNGNSEIAEFYHSFRRECGKGQWDSKDEVEEYSKANIDLLIDGLEGANELATHKAMVFVELTGIISHCMFEQMEKLLHKQDISDQLLFQYIQELKEFSMLRKMDLFQMDKEFRQSFNFDFGKIKENNFAVDPHDYLLPEPVNCIFFHDEEQKKVITGLVNEFGTSLDGIARIVMVRAHLKSIFRTLKEC